MAKQNLYDLLGVSPTASEKEIAIAVRTRLETAQGDDREVVIHAAGTLLSRESRESYDRLSGIRMLQGRAEVAADNANALAKYADMERAQQGDSSFAEVAWTLNFIIIGTGIGIWLLMLYWMMPSLTAELRSVLSLSRDAAFAGAVAVLTLPTFALGFLVLNIFNETLHITLRYILVCFMLGGVIWAADATLAATDAVWWIRIIGLMVFMFGTIMFIRHLGLRQIKNMGASKATPSRRRQ